MNRPRPSYRASSDHIGSLVMPFPLRKGYLAQIVVPRDMTRAEADRLCAYLLSLAVPENEQAKG